MKNYLFRCPRCQAEYEVPDHKQVIFCDKDGIQVQRVFTPPGISFKGSGFFTTDQRNKKHNIKENP